MSQNHGHLRVAEGQLPPSTFSTRSDYGSGFEINHDQQLLTGYGSNGGFPAPMSAHGGGSSTGGLPRVALPPNVKYPPSYHQQRQPQQQIGHSHITNYPPPQPRAVALPPPTFVGTIVSQAPPTIPMSSEYGVGVVSDVIRQLDTAADENNRLRLRLQDNNRILEEKVQEIQRCLESRDRDKQELQARIVHLEGRLHEAERKRETEKAQREETQRKSMSAGAENTVDETTNKLFEAQVAVMGFKCRVMQLKGELDDLRKDGSADAGAMAEIERLNGENGALREDLARAKKERDAATSLPQPASIRSERELIKKVRDLTELNKSQEVVIKHVYQELTDKRDLFASETQRMHQQNQQLQAEMQRLQAELLRVQNQLASHQQTSEQQLTSLTTRLNMSRQEQARTQELAKQLSLAHAEISKLSSDLAQRQREVVKFKKKSEVYETKAKDSTTKMMSMQDQMKEQQKQTPVPKPRGDLSQLKTERERLETELATVQSSLDRERQAREGVETELQEERKKSQAIILKNSQLMAQLGTGGEGVPGSVKAGLEGESQQLERSVSEGRVREKEGELHQLQLEVERLRREKSQSDATITELEKERKEAIDAKIEADSKLATMNEEMTSLRNNTVKSSEAGKVRAKPLEVRLNEYAGKLATLEGLFDEEKTAKAKVQSKLEEEKKHTQELERKNLELEREKTLFEGEALRSLQQQKHEVDQRLHSKETEVVSMNVRHQEEMDRLRAEMSTQKQNYERKIQEKGTALRSKEKDLESAQQSLQTRTMEKDGEMQGLRQDLQKWRTESLQKDDEIVRIHRELQSHIAQLHALQTEKETLRANEGQLSIRVQETLRENDHLKQELTNTQKLAGEFRKECQSLVADYEGAAKKIESLEEERDRYRNQANMGMRELAQRGERVKALEGERKHLQDQLQHMDLQLKQYMADFRSEREMRESAFQVKEMAERKQQELSTEVSTLQRQLTEMQTVKHMDSDVGNNDDPPSVAGVGVIGGREGGQPDRWSGSSRGRPAPAIPRQQPNEHSIFPHSVDPGSANAPPLPPKPAPGGEYHARPPNPSIPQHYVGPGSQGFAPQPRQELVTPQVMRFQQGQPPVSQPPGHMLGMSPGGNVAMGTHPQAGGTHNIPVAPNSRTEVPRHPYPRAGVGPMAGDPHVRTGGPVGGAQPGGMRQVPVSRPMVAPVHTEPVPPRLGHNSEGSAWVAPGDIVNPNRPEEACPLCNRNDFATVTDLEIHSARCTL